LPSDIKKAAIALALSCISTLLAVYFDGVEFAEIGFSNPITLGFNFVWTLVIAWIIWDLFKGKEIKLTLILVSIVMLISTAWDISAFGFGMAQQFYALELILFIAAYCFVNTQASKAWYLKKNA